MTRDIDEMLTAHDERPDPLVSAGVIKGGNSLNHASDEERYGTEPRTDWPASHWNYTPADHAERDYWVRKLYADEGLATTMVARRMQVDRNVVRSIIARLGIQRPPGTMGKTPRQEAQANRRAKVREVFEAREGRIGPGEIARILGVGDTSVSRDMIEMGLVPVRDEARRQPLDQTVDRAVQQMADLGDLLLNHRYLSLLEVDLATADELRKRLSKIVRSVNHVRRYLPKGETTP